MQNKKKEPWIHETCFTSPLSYISGDVRIEKNCSVWPYAVIRGDEDSIRIGSRTNVQDGVIIHVDGGFPINIEEEVSIGHGAILHGCEIGERCIIGIRSTILNGAKIGKGCIVGAGAVITPGSEIPPYSMVLGIPGKVKKVDENFEIMGAENARVYVELSREYKNGEIPELVHR
ncbi:MAG: gamma carbonic anhydrase family protein [Candidatus Thermoplasmatota archaeon]|nr:gamma carbonic anhydrase family protein [Candidatus Thermoplasmatota archaeon]